MARPRDFADLKPIVHDSVTCRDGAFYLQLTPEIEVPLVNSEGAIKSFATGWRPGLVLTIFVPVLLLEFRHDSGRGGFWLLDMDGCFIGNDFSQLPPALLKNVRLRAAPAMSWLADPVEYGCSFVVSPTFLALLAVHLDIRRQVARVVFEPDDPRAASDRMLEGPAEASSRTTMWQHPAALQIRQDGRMLELGPGWRIEGVQTMFAPVVILELIHDDGHLGVWYVDHAFNYLGNSATHLRGIFRDRVAAHCAVMFTDLWGQVIMAPAVPPGPDLQILLSLSRHIRIDLVNFHLSCTGQDTRHALVWLLDSTLPPSMHYTVPAGNGHAVLDPVHTRRACQQFLRTELFRDVACGSMCWPSPIDGRSLMIAPRTFYLDDLCFTYQVYDDRHDLTFYAFAMEGFFRTFALYFPAANLVVAQDAQHFAKASLYCDKAAKILLQHAAMFGPELVPALLQGPIETVHAFRGYAAIHLGHFIWQDLSGVSYLVDAFPPEKLPRFFVFDTRHHPELYGPIDEIFPELIGKVVRISNSFNENISNFYRDKQHVIKSTGITVPAQVGTRIISALRRSERWADLVARAERARVAGPIVLLGLRIGNRTVEDMEGFVTRLVQVLIDTLGSLTVVIDGHNSTGETPDTTYASYGDTLTGGSTFLQRERAIAASLICHFAKSKAAIIDNIGRPIADSIIWCSEADFFVAPWGAALAKYRWVCNTPGLTTVGRWNLEHRHDLAIYHDPAAMENPTLLQFNAIEAVEDLVAIDGSESECDRSNYRLDEAQLHAQVRVLAARFCAARDEPGYREGG